MAGERASVNLGNLVERHRLGASFYGLAELVGDADLVADELVASGDLALNAARSAAARFKTSGLGFDGAACVDLYMAGASEKALAERFGVQRQKIRGCLIARAVEPRGRHAAEVLKWAQRKARPDYARICKRQCGEAWRAATGRTKTEEELTAAARTRYLRGGLRGHDDETRIHDALTVLGVKLEKQFAVGRYNLDLAEPSLRVAIEVVSTAPKPSNAVKLRKRTEHLFSLGWFVIFVNLIRGPERRPIVLPRVAEKVLALRNRAGIDPSIRGRYAVVGRQGEPCSALRKYLYDLPVVEHA